MLAALFRRVEFRGKGRLRPLLRVPSEGERVVSFPGGMRLRLDLRESLQRDYYAGLYDRAELELLRRELGAGGDFVDVGAHVGVYTIAAALALGDRGRVLALEPNPSARAQLALNIGLNRCANVEVVAAAAADQAGDGELHVPATPDPAFSSLGGGRFAQGPPVRVDVTTVDREVEARGLRPALVKIDVEGEELRVLAGAERTLALRPVLLVEVGEATAAEAERLLAARGYRGFRLRRGRLVPGLAGSTGTFNAVFR